MDLYQSLFLFTFTVSLSGNTSAFNATTSTPSVSLNFDKYVAEQKQYKEEAKKMDVFDKEIEGVEVVALKADAFPDSDTVKVNKNKDWYKSIKKDIYLNETVQIMNDMNNGVTMNKGKEK